MQPNNRTSSAEQLRIAVFAGMADRVGSRSIVLPWREGSVADLRRLVAERHPEIVPLLERSAIAIDGRYAADDERVALAAEAAIIPPVSGG